MLRSTYQKWSYLHQHNTWIAWNLFLAAIPLLLSFYLFRRSSTARSAQWWIGLAIYAAFLPNAPYLLTDVVHLIEASWSIPSVWILTLFYIPIHVGAILLGFEAYVVSLINQSFYLRRSGLQRFIIPLEWLTHSLCAVGIYLGRFRRLNSWNIITAPQNVLLSTLNDLTDKRPLIVIALTAFILGILYWIMKQVTIGLLLRLRELRAQEHSVD